MPGVFEALTAVVGAGYGIYQAVERDRQAYRDSWRADLMYESTKKRARAEEAMLQNNLTIGAMDNTSANRDSAVAEYQNRSAQIAQAGTSGVSSGTPFYKIDSDAIQNRQRLSEIEDRGRMGLEGMGLQLEAAQLSSRAQIDVAFQQKQDSAESAAYAASPFAYIMGGLTGALSGASMGAGISTLTKDVFGVTVDEAVGGAFSALKPKTKGEYSLMSPDHEPGLPAVAIKDWSMGPVEKTRRDPVGDLFSRASGSMPQWGMATSLPWNTSESWYKPKTKSVANMFPSALGYPTIGIPSMNTSQNSQFPSFGGSK